MTDITELAQSLKAEDISSERMEWLNKLADMEYCASNPGHWLMNLKETNYLASLALQCLESNSTLVEALEKAQQVDEELCKLLPPGAEYMDPPDGGDVTPLEGVRRMVADYRQRIAELESRTVTVNLPPELYTIGELIRTQDNRITDQPMFVVFQKREIIGSDEHSPSRICWVFDGEEVSELRAKRLEALYQDGRDTRGYDRYAMQEVDEFVTACFTEQGCKDYLRQNGHNLRQPYIYACGSFRNNEYQLVRNWLAGIKREAE